MTFKTLRPGDKAIMLIELEHSGFEDNDPDDDFTCILKLGQTVEIASEPIGAKNVDTGKIKPVIRVKAKDTEGIDRTFNIDVSNLTSAANIN